MQGHLLSLLLSRSYLKWLSQAFAADANGYVRGEGACFVLLRPLAAARAAGQRVYAVVRGSAVNQDGRSQGLTGTCLNFFLVITR
jgi:acyl transferase domain-containing protein